MILSGMPGYIKTSPKSHRLEGIHTTDHHRFVMARWPKPYPMNSAQRKVSSVADQCGIKKGMSRGDLVSKMVDCVGPKMRTGHA